MRFNDTYTYTGRPGALARTHICTRLCTLAFRHTGGCIVDGKRICDLSLQDLRASTGSVLLLRENVH